MPTVVRVIFKYDEKGNVSEVSYSNSLLHPAELIDDGTDIGSLGMRHPIKKEFNKLANILRSIGTDGF